MTACDFRSRQTGRRLHQEVPGRPDSPAGELPDPASPVAPGNAQGQSETRPASGDAVRGTGGPAPLRSSSQSMPPAAVAGTVPSNLNVLASVSPCVIKSLVAARGALLSMVSCASLGFTELSRWKQSHVWQVWRECTMVQGLEMSVL